MISRNQILNSLLTSNAQPMIFSVISRYGKADRRSSCKSMFVSTFVSTGDGYATLPMHRCLSLPIPLNNDMPRSGLLVLVHSSEFQKRFDVI